MSASLLPSHLTTFASPTILHASADWPTTRVSTVLAGSGGHIFVKPPPSAADGSPVTRERRLSAPSQSPGSGTDRVESVRPQSLPLVAVKQGIILSGSSLVSPETPRPKKPYVLHYQGPHVETKKTKNNSFYKKNPLIV